MSGKPIRLLITGGLGNLGSWVTHHFSANEQYDVTVLTKTDRELTFPQNFKKIFCDIEDKEAVKKGLEGLGFDYVIHLASLNETFLDNYDSRSLSVNAYGTRNLLSAVAGMALKRFIYISTFHVYGRETGEIKETDTLKPLNDYAITHLFAEEYIKMFAQKESIAYTIFRLSNSYGCPKDLNSGKWYLLFNDLCKQAILQQRLELKTNGTQVRDFICMKDVCQVLEQCVTMHFGENNIYNLGSASSLSLLSVADSIASAYAEVYGSDITIQVNNNDTKVYPSALYFSVDKLKAETGFVATERFKEEAKAIFKLLHSE